MKLLYIALLLLFSISLSAQNTQQYKFRVYLKDKGNTEFSVSEPEKFLTKQAIERKKTQQTKIDETDFPISTDYFAQITDAGAKVAAFSKWFKTITIQLSDSAQIDNILQLSFVDSARYVWRGNDRERKDFARSRLSPEFCRTEKSENFFGITAAQFALHNAENMMLSGFSGKGLRVAVIDAGFTNVDVIPHFPVITGFKNFVPTGQLFASSDHGTNVLSTMALNLPNQIMGSAPSAMYYLLRSEDTASEFPVEEDYWVRAIEYADSIGVDVVNTSLGYSSFDDKSLNYKHNDLDGKTSFMTLAADKAYEKGMLLVTSAGNEGNKEWQKISAPADAKYVLTVGAVAVDSTIASFSSKGFTADKRVKPDVVSVGHGTFTIGQNGLIRRANGTSFSSPFLAGLVASLWSINPDMNRREVLDIVKRSSDRYSRPDSVYGFGIPDFGKAMKEVLEKLKTNEKSVAEKYFSITRPAKDNFLITLTEPNFSLDAYQVNLLDESGTLISKHAFEKQSLSISIPTETRKTNKFIYFVFKSPYTQKTVRFRL